MTSTSKSTIPITLTDLPPELWDHITSHLPTASAVASLDRTSKSLHEYVSKDGWKIFARTRFPSLYPSDASQYHNTARSLTTLSRAWDRRGIVARYIDVTGLIRSFPGGKKVDQWTKPRGQTIGFAPQLDVFEEFGSDGRERTENLAFSAGAEVCIRQTKTGRHTRDDRRWYTYRPLSAFEGKDDVTALHLLHPHVAPQQAGLRMITGTANGDLQLINFPPPDADDNDLRISYFTTQGAAVRSSSIFQDPGQTPLLAVNLGDTQTALYTIDPQQPKMQPHGQVHIHPPLRPDGNPLTYHRTWSSSFLSAASLAVGTGPAVEPIHVFPITPSGLTTTPLRKYDLQCHSDDSSTRLAPTSFAPNHASSVYTVVPLPATHTPGQIFLSGAYDGIVRLHDQRSPHSAEQTYVDPADDSAIYSLLVRGQEKLFAGTSRHNLLKVFDLRRGGKRYTYLDAARPSDSPPSLAPSSAVPTFSPSTNSTIAEPEKEDHASADFNIFLRNHHQHTHVPSSSSSSPVSSRRGRRTNAWSSSSRGHARAAESSIYSLASPAPHSPFIYAGVEGAVVSIACTEALDAHPDPLLATFSQREEANGGTGGGGGDEGEVLGLAMYEQDARMRLRVQRGLAETRRMHRSGGGRRWGAGQGRGEWSVAGGWLDERWRDAAE